MIPRSMMDDSTSKSKADLHQPKANNKPQGQVSVTLPLVFLFTVVFEYS
jgi:hypothetical protein